MGEETIKRILRNLKLTEKEAEVYIFLSKHGVLKCGEIAKGMNRHKAQIYRILRVLQTKGLLEATLEAPARFTAVAFETVLDLSIKAKRDEAVQMENTRQEILSYWKSIHQSKLEPQLEKFVVIEGNRRIYPKIFQMIKGTKNQFSAVATVAGFLRADQFGLFDAISTHPLRSKIDFRFITELSSEDLSSAKAMVEKLPKTRLNLRGRIPELGLQLSPRMVIRDSEEALFFITPRIGKSIEGKDEVGLWTDCKELVLSFLGIFENMWRDASDIRKKIFEAETDKPPKTCMIEDEEKATQNYTEMLRSAGKEIMLMTSSGGLKALWQNASLLDEVVQRGVSIKIMAPIVDENQEAAKQLAERSQVRHIAMSDLGTTIIDGKHLFQFKDIAIDQDVSEPLHLSNMYYSDDAQYVNKMKVRMDDIWRKAPVPSYANLELSFGPLSRPFSFFPSASKIGKTGGPVVHLRSNENEVNLDTPHIPSMEFVQERIRHYNQTREPITAYGWMARAILRLPGLTNMPMVGITLIHLDDKSAFGGGYFLEFGLWRETPLGGSFVPSALLVNKQGAMAMQPMYEGTPASQNMVLIETYKEVAVFRKGQTVFLGWTVNIPLPPSEYCLGPSCILFKGHGPAQQKTWFASLPSGYKSVMDYKVVHAFVTFMNASQPYVATGIQGNLINEYVMKTTKP